MDGTTTATKTIFIDGEAGTTGLGIRQLLGGVDGVSLRQIDPALRNVFIAGRAHMVGTSGAITSLAGIHLGLRRYQRSLVDGLWMSRSDCEAAAETLKRLGVAGRAAEPCIGPDRADLVLAGAAIMEAVQRAWPSDRVRVADRGLREGLLLQQMREDGKPTRRRRRGRS